MSKEHAIQAHLPGVFYRRPSPDAEPFVSEGDEVQEGTTIGLIELMKSYHEVQSTVNGTLVRFAIEDEGDVDTGTDIAIVEGND